MGWLLTFRFVALVNNGVKVLEHLGGGILEPKFKSHTNIGDTSNSSVATLRRDLMHVMNLRAWH